MQTKSISILFICGNVSINSSQGVRYRNLFREWAMMHKLTILSYSPFEIDCVEDSHFLINQSNDRKERNDKYFWQFFLKFYKKYIRQFIFPDRYKYTLTLYKQKLKEILKNNQFDVVIIGITPYSLYELTQFVKSQDNRIKVFVDLSDPFFENATNRYNLFFNKHRIRKYESRFIKYCDGIIVLNPTIKNLYDNIYNLENRVYVIEQGYSPLKISIQDENIKQENYKLIYAGALSKKFRNPFPLYQAINKATEKWHLDLYGNISEELIPLNNPNINFYGVIDHKRLVKKYAQSDVIVFIDNAFGYQVPGKLFEVISIGKPVLFIYSNSNSPSLYYIAKLSHVIMVENDVEKISLKLNEIRNLKFTLFDNNGYKQYNWANLSNTYMDLIYDKIYSY